MGHFAAKSKNSADQTFCKRVTSLPQVRARRRNASGLSYPIVKNNPARKVNIRSEDPHSPPFQHKGSSPSSSPWLTLLLSSLLFILTLLTFSPVRTAEFLNIDDNEYVTENPFVNTGLRWSNITWAFTQSHSGHWHPLTWISHMIDCELFGMNAGAHHLVNLGFHAAGMIALFLFLHSATGALARSLFAASFIAIDPLRMESVAWVSERKDVLSTLFAMLTLLAYCWYVKKPGITRYAAVVFPFVMGLLSKPMLVSLPFLLLLLDFWPLNRFRPKLAVQKSITEKIPLIALAVIVSFLALRSQELAGGLKTLQDIALGERFTTVTVGYLIYLGKFFWPFHLGIFYPLQPVTPGLAAGAFLALTAITFWILQKGQAFLKVGWLWFLISLLPVIGILHIGSQQVADRWTYLPHVGLAVAFAWSVCEYTKRFSFSRTLLPLLSVAVIAGLALETHTHLDDWQTSEKIFSRTLEVAPNNFFAHTNLAVALEKREQIEEAAMHYEAALRYNPVYAVALNNLGSLRARAGKYQEAIELFDRALASHPFFVLARYHRGLAKDFMAAPLEAILEWVTVLQQDMNFERARASLAFVLDRELRKSCDIIKQQVFEKEPGIKSALEQRVSSWSVTDERDRSLKSMMERFLRCSP